MRALEPVLCLLSRAALENPPAAAATAQAPSQAPADPYARPAAAGKLPTDITLYQYEVCPFCCKVKAMLDYYKVMTGGRGPS